jgi:hypothetical protein
MRDVAVRSIARLGARGLPVRGHNRAPADSPAAAQNRGSANDRRRSDCQQNPSRHHSRFPSDARPDVATAAA